MASIVSSYGGYGTGLTFVAGLTPAIWLGAAVVAVAVVAALSIPRRRRPPVEAELVPESGELGGAAFRTRHWLSYSSWRRHQKPVSLRPNGARSSHWYMPQRPSTPRSYAE